MCISLLFILQRPSLDAYGSVQLFTVIILVWPTSCTIQKYNLLCFFEEITKWVDEGSPVDVIYLDFQKAFDKVPHQRLLLKVYEHFRIKIYTL